MPHKYLLVKTDGKTSEVTSDKALNPEESQKLIGGQFEDVKVIKGLRRNKLLPEFVGPVLFGRVDRFGNFIGLTEKMMKTAREGLQLKTPPATAKKKIPPKPNQTPLVKKPRMK